MFINGKDVSAYGAITLSGYKYTPPKIEQEYFKGRQRTGFTILCRETGMGQLDLTLTFYDRHWRDVTQKKAAFDRICMGEVEISIGDGYEYRSVLTEIGQSNQRTRRVLECTYSFDCVRHGPYVEKHGNTIICESTLPYTDCVLTARVGQDGTNYQMGPVMFDTVYSGQVLTVDGITKRILVGGEPDASGARWLRFPSLEPGENTFSCLDELTVGYYPSYF